MKILILSMSCNKPYYQALLGVVRDTWAKPLIQNKYDNITWFGYTSCDERHPEPMVDIENHMIYTSAGDDLRDTYFKTKEAYNMIKDVVDFDYVIRTNCSIFLNIDNLLKRLNDINTEFVYAGGFTPLCHKNGEFDIHIFIGYFISVNKDNFEKMLCSDEIELYNEGNITLNNDDVIMSRNLQKYFKLTGDNTNIIEPDKMISHYKVLPSDEDIPPEYQDINFVFTNDPNIINERILVRLRPIKYNVTNRNVQHELEHFYEINDVLNDEF